MTAGLPHSVTLTLTGWAVPCGRGVRVNGIRARTVWKPESAQRVTVTA
ncbi:hypothetical protein [Deinococcus hopiensis]|nr:hypothetical protein [Deinococcus hopiensis]